MVVTAINVTCSYVELVSNLLSVLPSDWSGESQNLAVSCERAKTLASWVTHRLFEFSATFTKLCSNLDHQFTDHSN